MSKLVKTQSFTNAVNLIQSKASPFVKIATIRLIWFAKRLDGGNVCKASLGASQNIVPTVLSILEQTVSDSWNILFRNVKLLQLSNHSS